MLQFSSSNPCGIFHSRKYQNALKAFTRLINISTKYPINATKNPEFFSPTRFTHVDLSLVTITKVVPTFPWLTSDENTKCTEITLLI